MTPAFMKLYGSCAEHHSAAEHNFPNFPVVTRFNKLIQRASLLAHLIRSSSVGLSRHLVSAVPMEVLDVKA